MRVKEQFERYAKSYSDYSHIQKKIAKILVKNIDCKTDAIADFGCGSGTIYNELTASGIKFNNFYAIDFAKTMLKIHPNSSKVEKIVGDFNSQELFNELNRKNIDLTLSSSALQWAIDLDFTFNQISKISNCGLFFLFTSKTFKTLHNTIGIKSPIHTQDTIVSAFNKSFTPKKIEKYSFKLSFENTLEMLRYIKRGGVSGGLSVGYKELRYLINNYPKKYLEFETILLKGESRCQI